MIVRLMGEGQYRVDDGCLARLNELDDAATAALERDDEADLSASDLIIPPSDLTLEETRALFSEQGLIPDLPS